MQLVRSRYSRKNIKRFGKNRRLGEGVAEDERWGNGWEDLPVRKKLNKMIFKLEQWRNELQEEGTTQYWTEDISEKITKLLEEEQWVI